MINLWAYSGIDRGETLKSNRAKRALHLNTQPKEHRKNKSSIKERKREKRR